MSYSHVIFNIKHCTTYSEEHISCVANISESFQYLLPVTLMVTDVLGGKTKLTSSSQDQMEWRTFNLQAPGCEAAGQTTAPHSKIMNSSQT